MKTNYDRVRDWRQNTKQKLVEGFMGKCGHCGLQDHSCVYDFHHLNPDQKDFTLSGQIRAWASIIQEADKCVMLCAHCHRKVHAGIITLRDDIQRFSEAAIQSTTIISADPCPVCNGSKPNGQITCSRACASVRRFDWGSVDVVNLYKSLGSCHQVGIELGLSDNTVRKRLVKIGFDI